MSIRSSLAVVKTSSSLLETKLSSTRGSRSYIFTKSLTTMNSPTPLKVLISGAGIAGPCFAYWLSRVPFPINITLLERSPTPRTTGQAIDIHGPAIEIVKRMNLEPSFRAMNTTEIGTWLLNSKGEPLAKFAKGDAFTNEYEILRGDMSRLFMESLEGRNIKCIYGESITSLSQTSQEVTVTFSSGSEETYDLLVAADGSTSRTRAMILDAKTLEGSYNFLGQYLAFFSIPRIASDNKYWQVYHLPKGLCMMIRPHLNPSTVGIYLCITKPSRKQRDPDIEEAMSLGPKATKEILRRIFENAGWQAERILNEMDKAEDFYFARSAQVKLPQWSNNRAVLLGDTAWATFGVGTTLAVEGAYYLAGSLSTLKTSAEIPEALRKYERDFRVRYKSMEDLPPGFPQIGFPQTGWGVGVLRSIAWGVSKTGLHKVFGGPQKLRGEVPEYQWVE